MADSGLSKASSFTIKELSGDERELVLRGRALPYRPVQFSGTMRADFTWYPGNPEATVQVLGAAEDDTTIKGMWKNKFLGDTIEASSELFDGQPQLDHSALAQLDGIDITTAMALCKVVDGMRRAGQLMRVTWDEITRVGILTRFVQNFDRRQDVEWEITFGWVSQGDATVSAVTSREPDLSFLQASWSKVLNDLEQARLNSPLAQLQSFTARIDSAVNKIEDAILEIGDTVGQAVNSLLPTSDTVKRLAGIMSTIQDSSQALVEQLDSAPAITDFDVGVPPGLATMEQMLNAAEFNRGLYDAARAAQFQAANQAADLARRIDPDLVATFVARQDLDLRDVSTRFYGTPEEWKRLLVFNGLVSSGLTRGQVIFVPSAQSQRLT